jgi:uncharacterized RDD family membrane protein YckC
MTSANDDVQMLRPQGDFPAAGLGRRMAAISYDALLCMALMMVTTFLYKVACMGVVGEARLRQLSESGALDTDPLLSSILLITLFGFFAKFWTRGGQTLGMQVWSIRVQNTNGSAISLWQALLRFIVAITSWLCLGLGFFWGLFDKDRRCWHDMYSQTQLVRVPRIKK